MPRIAIGKDEKYPVFDIILDLSCSEKTVEVPDALVERYTKALDDWQAVQDELEELYRKVWG